jgi:hypothetical protein
MLLADEVAGASPSMRCAAIGRLTSTKQHASRMSQDNAMTLENILNRIAAVGGQSPCAGDVRSLLHAYVACLTFDELCAAIVQSLTEPVDVRLALRGRLLRLLGDNPAVGQRDRLVTLVVETSALSDTDKALQQTTDALHSALIRHLPITTQQYLLERWIGRGTRGAMARWLKATRDTPSLFDASVALTYWRATRDYRAAKSLAYQASPEVLRPILSEIVAHCEEGWIISKAIVHGGCDDEVTWGLVRANHPATYLYLCAQLRRDISDDDAFDLAWACPSIAIHGDRGLAIWAIGQMGKVAVLDRIRGAAEALFEKDTAELRARYPDMPASDASDISTLSVSPMAAKRAF